MAVPEFKVFLLPTLEWYADGREHKLGELDAPLSDHFGLSEEDRSETLESGTQTRLHNRVVGKSGTPDELWETSLQVIEQSKGLICRAGNRARFSAVFAAEECAAHRVGVRVHISGWLTLRTR